MHLQALVHQKRDTANPGKTPADTFCLSFILIATMRERASHGSLSISLLLSGGLNSDCCTLFAQQKKNYPCSHAHLKHTEIYYSIRAEWQEWAFSLLVSSLLLYEEQGVGFMLPKEALLLLVSLGHHWQETGSSSRGLTWLFILIQLFSWFKCLPWITKCFSTHDSLKSAQASLAP